MNPELVNTFGRTLAETERLRRAKLNLYQAPLLQRLLRHARDTTEFYRTRVPADCDSTEAIEEAWSSIPILTRVEANANRDGTFVAPPGPLTMRQGRRAPSGVA